MKYKLFGITMAALILVVSIAAAAVEDQEGVQRVHQHLTARQPGAGCDCDGSELCTHLPLVVIDTGGEMCIRDRNNPVRTIGTGDLLPSHSFSSIIRKGCVLFGRVTTVLYGVVCRNQAPLYQ